MGMRSYRRPERVSALSAFGVQGGAEDKLTRGSGYDIFSTLIAGLVAYGGIGWAIGHFAHIPLSFPIGMMIGVAISVGWVIFKYGRPHERGNPPKGDDR